MSMYEYVSVSAGGQVQFFLFSIFCISNILSFVVVQFIVIFYFVHFCLGSGRTHKRGGRMKRGDSSGCHHVLFSLSYVCLSVSSFVCIRVCACLGGYIRLSLREIGICLCL